MKLLAIISKNIKILMSNKISTSMILAGPLVLLILISLGFTAGSLSGIILGFYSDDHSSIESTLLDAIKSTEFRIDNYKNEQECIESVVKGSSHICLSLKKQASGQSQLKFYVDYSQYNLVWQLVNAISQKTALTSTSFSKNATGTLLGSIQKTREALNVQKESIRAITDEMNSIQAQLSFTSVNAPTPNNQAIDASIAESKKNKDEAYIQKERIIARLRESDNKLAEMQSKVLESKNKLEVQRTQLQQARLAMQQAYVDRQCINTVHKDLTPFFYDSDKFSEELSKTNGECSILLTARSQLDDQIEENDRQISELENLLVDIDKSRAAIVGMETEAEVSYQNTAKAINSLNDGMESIKGDLNKVAEEYETEQRGAQEKARGSQDAVARSATAFADIEAQIGMVSDNLGSFTELSPDMIASPFTTKIESVTRQRKTYEYMIPVLFTILAIFVGVLISSMIVVKENKSKAHFRNTISPTNPLLFLVGTFLTTALLLSLQFILLLLISRYVLHIFILSNPVGITITLFLVSSSFILLGMIIGHLFRTEEMAILASVCVIILSIFFSGIILPAESINQPFNVITKMSTFYPAHHALNKFMILELGLMDALGEITEIILKIVSLLALLAVVFYLRRKK